MKTTTRTAVLSLLMTGLLASAAASAAPNSPSSTNDHNHAGQTEAQVQSRLGKPDRVMQFGSETVWVYYRAPGVSGDDGPRQISFYH